MSDDAQSNLSLEIGHVLFIDIVGYSKMLIEDQRERLDQLTKIVLATPQVRASRDEKLVRLPTGDGMALVFHQSAEEPARCALELAEALRKHPEIPVRMGIHSGPISQVTDVSERNNIAGAGINLAQRVMDCGDVGHILMSQHVADDLMQYRQWAPRLRDLGECEVKHGVRLHLVNLYAEPLGNAAVPQKFKASQGKTVSPRRKIGLVAALAAVALIGASAAYYFTAHRSPENAVSDKSIAVLPFENLSSDKENAYFTDGVQDEILTNLARIADLKVISRSSVMHYKSSAERNLRKIGGELGVAHVLEGSVQRAANRVRVNAQLIDARTDAHLWAQTYDRDLADVFAIQSEIAKTIAEQLQAKLSPGERSAISQPPTKDLVAFDLYTRAKDLVLLGSSGNTANADLLKAIDLLTEAVMRDPSFFDAYCFIADAHDSLYAFGFDHTPARLQAAATAIDAAARLRPNAGQTHLARAQHVYQGYLDYSGALRELELARQKLPNDSRVYQLMGFIQRRQKGRYLESTRTLEHALELNPRDELTLGQIAGFNYRRVGNHAAAKSAWDRLLSIRPNDPDAKVGRAIVDFDWKADTRALHETVEAIHTAEPTEAQHIAIAWLTCALAERDPVAAKNALDAVGNAPVLLSYENVIFNRAFADGLIARMNRDETAARSHFAAARTQQEKVLAAQPNYAPALCVMSLIDAGLGRKEEALREGRRAVELLPVEKDEPEGLDIVKYFAMAAGWVGEKDLACQQLAIAAAGPSGLTYGELKLLPMWDPLRGEERFEKIVASFAPKD